MAANYAKEMKYSDIGMSATDRSIAVTKNLKLPSIAYTYNGKLYFGNNADLPSDQMLNVWLILHGKAVILLLFLKLE